MAEAFVTLERRHDDVALVQLDRPKANALSVEVLAQLTDVATELRDEPPGAVVLWGGRRIFAAGEEFTTAVKALAAGELDPYQAADRLLAE